MIGCPDLEGSGEGGGEREECRALHSDRQSGEAGRNTRWGSR